MIIIILQAIGKPAGSPDPTENNDMKRRRKKYLVSFVTLYTKLNGNRIQNTAYICIIKAYICF